MYAKKFVFLVDVIVDIFNKEIEPRTVVRKKNITEHAQHPRYQISNTYPEIGLADGHKMHIYSIEENFQVIDSSDLAFIVFDLAVRFCLAEKNYSDVCIIFLLYTSI